MSKAANFTSKEERPPDLNPIEHAWVLLERYVTEDYPDLADTLGDVDAVKARLAEVCPSAGRKYQRRGLKPSENQCLTASRV